jgi:hypothetical protein
MMTLNLYLLLILILLLFLKRIGVRGKEKQGGRSIEAAYQDPWHELARRLGSSEDDMLKALRTMSEIGMVAMRPDGWLDVDLKRRSMKRECNAGVTNRNADCDAAAAPSSASASASNSFSVSLEGVRGVGEGETNFAGCQADGQFEFGRPRGSPHQPHPAPLRRPGSGTRSSSF